MKKEGFLKPHDIVLLLKMTHASDKRQLTLSQELDLSQSEVSAGLYRSMIAGLIDEKKKLVYRTNLLELIIHGLKYFYPTELGRVQRGIPTGHAASPLKEEIISDKTYIWPYHKGKIRGESLEPLYPGVIHAIQGDQLLYEKLALIDAIRLRNPRETQLAISHLRNLIVHGAEQG